MQSLYDPNRKTVGSIYRDAQLSNREPFVIAGDLTNEMLKGYVEDLNETLKSNPFKDNPFYILFHEKKDLQMPNCILRRVIVSKKKRPYPEDNTTTFWTDPISTEVRFCWCLPSSYEMENILNNQHKYDKQYISDIKAWIAVDLEHFGIKKIDGKLKAIPNFKDRPLKKFH